MAPHRRGRRGSKRSKPYHKKRSRKKKKNDTNPTTSAVHHNNLAVEKVVKSVEEVSSESEDETNPYQELVTSLPKNATPQQQFSDEEFESDEEENTSDEEIADDEDNRDDLEVGDDHDHDDADDIGDEVGEDNNNDGDEEESNHSDELTEDADEVIEDTENSQDYILRESDPFSIHFETLQEEALIESYNNDKKWNRTKIKVAQVGHGTLQTMGDQLPSKPTPCEFDLHKQHVKQRLCHDILDTNQRLCDPKGDLSSDSLTYLQHSLFHLFNNYQDVYYPERSVDNGEEVRLTYCLHALNHILKTRSRIISHNTKFRNKAEEQQVTKKKKKMDALEDTQEYRDQGLTRPKVLMVLPFRESVIRVINMMIGLIMPKNQKSVSVKKRLQEEYGDTEEVQAKFKKPDDFEAIFAGNIDDHFRIGLSVTKTTLKLYTNFYMSDIILASPLGLRTIIGSEGEPGRDYDFLNSIELLILDQADIFLMQNWDHVLHLMNHLHLQPKEPHGVDFSRVRMWTLNGWSKFYRQTLVFSSIAHPMLNALFNKHCHNFAGKLTFSPNQTSGTIRQIVAQIPQVFHKIHCSSHREAVDARFDFFIKKILPHHKNSVMSQTMIFIPSYFDFVRVRNFFVRENLDFVHINEYSEVKKISKARTKFFHGRVHFMLYTERCHFYKRYRIRGIRHLIFYDLPQYAQYYSELCNMFNDRRVNTEGENLSCTVMYTQYDAQKLSETVGADRASHMLNSDKKVHMFVTGENS